MEMEDAPIAKDEGNYLPISDVPDESVSDSQADLASTIESDINTDVTKPVNEKLTANPVSKQTAVNTQQPPQDSVIGTGVALISIGEPLLAATAADFVRQVLERRGIVYFDGLTISGVAAALDGGDGNIQKLIRPHARYLVYIVADFTGERELQYMGRYDTEYQARLSLETHDLLDGRSVGPGIHTSIGYTQLSVENKVSELLRPEFGPIAGNLSK